MIPGFTITLKPGYLNGLLLFIRIVPFIPPGPYKADDAPGNSSTLSTSSSVRPVKFPTKKFNPGAWLSIPSTSWLTLVLPLPLKPRVLGVLKVRLDVVISTPAL